MSRHFHEDKTHSGDAQTKEYTVPSLIFLSTFSSPSPAMTANKLTVSFGYFTLRQSRERRQNKNCARTNCLLQHFVYQQWQSLEHTTFSVTSVSTEVDVLSHRKASNALIWSLCSIGTLKYAHICLVALLNFISSITSLQRVMLPNKFNMKYV